MSDWFFSLRTEDPVAEGQNPLTWTTRTNLTSVTVRENTLYIMCRHYVISVISFQITLFTKAQGSGKTLFSLDQPMAKDFLYSFMMYCQEAFLYMLAINSYIFIFQKTRDKSSIQVTVSHLSTIAPPPSVLRAVCCSMKKGFAVNPDLTSMPLAYLGRILQEWIAMGMLREIDTLEQMNLILIFFCLVLSFLYCLFFLLLCLLCSRQIQTKA